MAISPARNRGSRRGTMSTRSGHVLRGVVGQLAAKIARFLRRILAAVLLATGPLVAEGLAAADDVDLLDFLFSCSLVVAHEVGMSKEDTGSPAPPWHRTLADEREIIRGQR